MRFATYGRKSVYSDKSDSVSNQERMCREYARVRFEVETFETYSDEGFTGANTNRPGLKRLLEDIEDGLIDALIVYQLDRISRNVKDFADIYSTLEQKDVMFVSIKENIDTATPIGKAMMYVTMVFAQMERETIAARVSDNMTGLVKKGLWVGGRPPYGYISRRIEIDGKKHVAIFPDPEGVEYVMWIFDTFLENRYSLHRMELVFRERGIKTLNGCFFSTSQLHKILTMPYCVEGTGEVYDQFASLGCQMDPGSPREMWDGTRGVMVYGRTSLRTGKHMVQSPDKWLVCLGYHEPFMPAEKWLAVQKQLRSNVFEKKSKYDVPLLKGVVRCAKCGCLLQAARKKTKSGVTGHYFCVKRSRQGREVCDLRAVKCEVLDEKVLSRLREIVDDPTLIMEHIKVDTPKNPNNIKELEASITRISAKIERLSGILADAEGSTVVKHILAQIEKEDLNLEAIKRDLEIAKAEEKRNRKNEKSVEAKVGEVARLIRGLDSFSAMDKNAIVKDLIKECKWDGETLFWRV